MSMTSRVRREIRLVQEEDGGWSAIDTRVGVASGGDTREEALEIFTEHEAAIAPVYSIADIFRDEHVAARDLLVEMEDEELGTVTLPGVVPKLSETPGRIEHPGPRLGERAREALLRRTSLTEDELRDLRDAGVVAYPD